MAELFWKIAAAATKKWADPTVALNQGLLNQGVMMTRQNLVEIIVWIDDCCGVVISPKLESEVAVLNVEIIQLD